MFWFGKKSKCEKCGVELSGHSDYCDDCHDLFNYNGSVAYDLWVYGIRLLGVEGFIRARDNFLAKEKIKEEKERKENDNKLLKMFKKEGLI